MKNKRILTLIFLILFLIPINISTNILSTSLYSHQSFVPNAQHLELRLYGELAHHFSI